MKNLKDEGSTLDVIAAPELGYNVSYLRAVVHHGKSYVRSMQRNLSLDPVKEEVRVLRHSSLAF